MSHAVAVKVIIDDLDSLDKACKRLGSVELVRDQKTYRWFGRSVGDTALPEGRTKDQLGTCDHAIRLTSPNGKSYEIGVYKYPAGTVRDGKDVGGKYSLEWDTWMGGYGLTDAVGADCGMLKQAYSTERTIKVARKQNYTVSEKVMADGTIRLTCNTGR